MDSDPSETPDGPEQSKVTPWEKFKKTIGGMVEDLFIGHERGTAIVYHAALVRAAIVARLAVAGESAKHLIGGNESPGVLGFSDQCRLAFCLGVFGASTFSDLKILTKVRNRFAHGGPGLTFDDEAIKNRCASLTICDRLKDEPEWRDLLRERNIYVFSDPSMRYKASAVLIQACLERESNVQQVAKLPSPSGLP